MARYLVEFAGCSPLDARVSSALLARLQALRDELTEFAFVLDRQGCNEAADVAIRTSARLRELHADFAAQLFSIGDVRNAAVDSLKE